MDRQDFAIYGGHDPRTLPCYTAAEAARYVGMNEATLRTWVQGRAYPTKSEGTKSSPPLIVLPDPASPLSSFINLTECHVLNAVRKGHGIAMSKVRPAIEYVRACLHVEHPLVDERFQTDGVDLFIQRLEQTSMDDDGQDQQARPHCQCVAAGPIAI